MAKNINYRDYRLQLLAGVPQSISVEGDTWQIITALAAVTLQFDEQITITRFAAMGGAADYRMVTVSSTVDQAVVISLGMTGRPETYDSRGSAAGGGGGATTIAANIGTVLRDPPDVVCPAGVRTQLVNVDATRFELIVGIPDTAGDGVRIGSSAVAADRGKKAYPGDEITYTNKGAIFLFNPTAAPITVYLQENLIP